MKALPVIYLPHGGGPCFFMDWNMGPKDTWDKLASWLRGLPASIGERPAAILVISAHWEGQDFTLSTNPKPPLLFDYYGFPEHTYQLEYPATGDVELARRVGKLLTEAQIPVKLDDKRGLDHGVFIPFKLIYPEADIPVVQLSLKAGLDPAIHLEVGRALQPLRSEGVLIVGSGMSYHNLGGFGSRVAARQSDEFDAWLTETVEHALSSERDEKLKAWLQAPSARAAHPREEHLLPLMVVAGAAGKDRGRKTFTDRIMGVTTSAFEFHSREE